MGGDDGGWSLWWIVDEAGCAPTAAWVLLLGRGVCVIMLEKS